MVAWRYKISLLMLKKIFTSERSERVKYFSTLEENFPISARPYNILYIYTILNNGKSVSLFCFVFLISIIITKRMLIFSIFREDPSPSSHITQRWKTRRRIPFEANQMRLWSTKTNSKGANKKAFNFTFQTLFVIKRLMVSAEKRNHNMWLSWNSKASKKKYGKHSY